ncbi:MAG TPA: ATP synthase F1 subunit delta [Caldimonas sp.]|nr:ATP synthase F1 subunit delta [Caldimonas sp.]
MKASPGVARSYGKALFELARERNQVDVIARELDAVAAQFASNPELHAFFARPWVTTAAKRGVAAEVAGRLKVSKLTQDFLALVAAQGRADHLEAIVAAFRELQDEAANRVRARVRAAVPLSDAERLALTGKLSRALGGKTVVLEEVADRELLGGFVAEVGSLLVDGSLDGQLARMHHRLAQE